MNKNNDNLILGGSTYFFKDFPDFINTDKDYCKIIYPPCDFKYLRHTHNKIDNYCLFEIEKMTPEEYIKNALLSDVGWTVCAFLIPELVFKMEFTIEHLKQLQLLVNKLDDKHLYLGVIYNSYIENNSFTLTEKQRKEAYDLYKYHRKNIYK